MITVKIPGSATLELQHLVMNFNGTLSSRGKLMPNVVKMVARLQDRLSVHVLTEDDPKQVEEELRGLIPVISVHLQASTDEEKISFIRFLGSGSVVVLGNSEADLVMMDEAALSIALIQNEEASIDTMLAADVICSDVYTAIDLLMDPERLVAALQS